jgi:hypothetical protein
VKAVNQEAAAAGHHSQCYGAISAVFITGDAHLLAVSLETSGILGQILFTA